MGVSFAALLLRNDSGVIRADVGTVLSLRCLKWTPRNHM
jgi:hypothetical protein